MAQQNHFFEMDKQPVTAQDGQVLSQMLELPNGPTDDMDFEEGGDGPQLEDELEGDQGR